MHKVCGVLTHLVKALGRRILGIFIFKTISDKLHEIFCFLYGVLTFLIWVFQDVADVFDDICGDKSERKILRMRQLEDEHNQGLHVNEIVLVVD